MNPEAESKITTRQIIKTYWKLLKWGIQANKIALPSLYILMIVVSFMPFINSFINSKVIDELTRLIGTSVEQRSVSTLIMLVILSAANDIIEKIIWSVVSLAEKVHYFGVARFFEFRFLEKYSKLDATFFQDQEKSNLIYRAQDVYAQKPRDVLNRSVWMLGDAIRIVTSFFIVISFSVPAFLIILITTLPSLIVNFKLGSQSWSIWDANATDRNRYHRSKRILLAEKSILELRIFKTSKYLLNFMFGIFDSFTDKEKANSIKRTFLESIVNVISTIGIILFYVIAIASTLEGDITVGLLTFYASSTSRFSEALSSFFRQLSRVGEDNLYIKQLFDFFEMETTLKDGTQVIDAKNGISIEFKNVWFKYPNTDKYVLKNFNLRIDAKDKVALVGENGAGKTTILTLITRIFDVDKGEILINGVNIQDIKIDSLYDQIGILFQNFIRYDHLDVRTNVLLGDQEQNNPEDKRVTDSLYKADALDFVNNYPNKLDQLLDRQLRGGIDPSVGQWQRIALARAFFRNSPILILDEPTSAIDAKGEYEIFERLFDFSKEKTVIIVSHRFSTVRKADRIFVIDEGQVIESGTHEELLKINGRYAEAFNLQAEGYR